MERKIEINPRTAINTMDSRQINIFCGIFKIYNVVFFLCPLYVSFHLLFHWKKTKHVDNGAGLLVQPRLRNTAFDRQERHVQACPIHLSNRCAFPHQQQ
jgi:hypothetical protein